MLTTHYMDEAEVLCDRVAIMDRGRILQLDSPAALVRGLDAPARITVAPGQLTLDEARRARASTTPGGRGRHWCSPPGSRRRWSRGWPSADHARRRPGADGTLEDVFLDLTGREYRA